MFLRTEEHLAPGGWKMVSSVPQLLFAWMLCCSYFIPGGLSYMLWEKSAWLMRTSCWNCFTSHIRFWRIRMSSICVQSRHLKQLWMPTSDSGIVYSMINVTDLSLILYTLIYARSQGYGITSFPVHLWSFPVTFCPDNITTSFVSGHSSHNNFLGNFMFPPHTLSVTAHVTVIPVVATYSTAYCIRTIFICILYNKTLRMLSEIWYAVFIAPPFDGIRLWVDTPLVPAPLLHNEDRCRQSSGASTPSHNEDRYRQSSLWRRGFWHQQQVAQA